MSACVWVCVCVCIRKVHGVNITAATCLLLKVTVCGVSVIRSDLNSPCPSIYNLYGCTACAHMHVCIYSGECTSWL